MSIESFDYKFYLVGGPNESLILFDPEMEYELMKEWHDSHGRPKRKFMSYFNGKEADELIKQRMKFNENGEIIFPLSDLDETINFYNQKI